MISRERARILDAQLRAKGEAPFYHWPSDAAHEPLDASDIAWLISHGKKDLRGAILNGLDLRHLDLEGLLLIGAYLKETLLRGLTQCYLQGAHLHKADLVGGNMRRCKCNGAEFDHAFLDGATFDDVNLTKARFIRAHVNGARFIGGTRLEDANFEGAELRAADFKGCSLRGAALAGCDLSGAHLEGADLSGARLAIGREVRLADEPGPTTLSGAFLNAETNLSNVTLADYRGHGPTIADVRWGDAILARTSDWRSIRRLGDEQAALDLEKDRGSDPEGLAVLAAYEAAVRANRQLGTALRGEGLNAWAHPFTYQARVLESRALRWRGRWSAPLALRRQPLTLDPATEPATLSVLWIRWALADTNKAGEKWLRESAIRARRVLRSTVSRMGLSVLWAVAGYGFKPWRSVVWYGATLLACTASYLAIAGHYAGPNCTANAADPMYGLGCGRDFRAALIMSVLSFHGRGLANGFDLQNPLTAFAAGEAIIGLALEVIFIAAFTQRVFSDS